MSSAILIPGISLITSIPGNQVLMIEDAEGFNETSAIGPHFIPLKELAQVFFVSGEYSGFGELTFLNHSGNVARFKLDTLVNTNQYGQDFGEKMVAAFSNLLFDFYSGTNVGAEAFKLFKN